MNLRRGLKVLVLRVKGTVRPCYKVEDPEQKARQRQRVVDRKLLMRDLDLANGRAHGR